MERALSGYREMRADLHSVQQKMAEISSSATAPRDVVSVTVDVHGQITAVTFPQAAYKNMAPAELAKVVCDTVRKAQATAREKMLELMESTMPPGLSMRGHTPGKVDFDELFPDNPEDSPLFRPMDER
ncbi:YbaB/EbfC family nucleoid-associated protein [Lentzea sp. BCCO 10_0061]|uniref:YbaB/EbfC family nucleoid-associated protein n=1 Tax=Lentzea sokolovensis TaxID=3095429 RepID=A0ABU4VCG6_9PSEU|nr:YbaB/EbfC family nucleoid-associated protein [Lentzea sp. BCCO 10_0061]MDX8149469.1 YbaB/EbfC family nucleoid-associated protein [Lentzea sp. BCCO 10_0061]